jgi:hypothetical protein
MTRKQHRSSLIRRGGGGLLLILAALSWGAAAPAAHPPTPRQRLAERRGAPVAPPAVVPVTNLKLIKQEGSSRVGTVLFDGQSYSNALQMEGYEHSAWMEFYLGKRYDRFRALVGVSDLAKRNDGAMVYLVEGDGQELYRSPPVRVGGAPQQLDVAVRGVLRLRLVATSAEWYDFAGDQSAVWVNPRVYPGQLVTPPTMAKIILDGDPLTTTAPIVNGELCVPLSLLQGLRRPIRSLDWSRDRGELVIETR